MTRPFSRLRPGADPEWSNFTRFFAQNFERFGLKKLVSTSYAPEAKKAKYGLDLFDLAEGRTLDPARGRILVLDSDTNGNGRIDFDDLQWSYLDGDGDFRSDEVRRLRDEADVIVTNPPFSLFREFLAWILEGKCCQCGNVANPNSQSQLATGNIGTGNISTLAHSKKFLIIGNMNAITYKEAFPLIKANRLWLGATGFYSDMVFAAPEPCRGPHGDRAVPSRPIGIAHARQFFDFVDARL
ncbi:MAG: hypothetical protein IJ678_00385 [Kiritimatiellae bacterium]|nr:hypothetical protein [Kiritimatiellia bacterium]